MKLTPEEQQRLAERLKTDPSEVRDLPLADNDDEPPLTPEEIEHLLHQGPKTGAEVAKSGLFGAWAHLGITDGATWVNEQKRKRLERQQWSLD